MSSKDAAAGSLLRRDVPDVSLLDAQLNLWLIPRHQTTVESERSFIPIKSMFGSDADFGLRFGKKFALITKDVGDCGMELANWMSMAIQRLSGVPDRMAISGEFWQFE